MIQQQKNEVDKNRSDRESIILLNLMNLKNLNIVHSNSIV